MEKLVRLFAMFLSSLLLFSACKPDEGGSGGPGSGDGEGKEFEIYRADYRGRSLKHDAGESEAVGLYIDGDTAYLELYSDRSSVGHRGVPATYYFYAGTVNGMQDLEPYIFDLLPLLTPVSEDENSRRIRIPLKEGDGYLIHERTDVFYAGLYIQRFERDAGGNIIYVYYCWNGFTPYEGWWDYR